MKKVIAILSIMLIAPCFASTFFQYDNPFPQDTDTSNLNNIYGTAPEVLKKEAPAQAAKQEKKNKWWKKDKTTPVNAEQMPVKIQESSDGSFYVFPARK